MPVPKRHENALVVVRAPGRVNLIGDHTDYTGGLVLPFAIDRYTVVRGRRGGGVVRIRSHGFAGDAAVVLPVDEAMPLDAFGWTRLVHATVVEVAPSEGFVGAVHSTVPVGAGLSSSASFETALALALGASGTPDALAQLCRRAEHRATGAPTGIMDQLVIADAVEGHALCIDCHTLQRHAVPLPPVDAAQVWVIDSGVRRELATSAYATRVDECARAEALIGPLRSASLDDVRGLRDASVRARARHVVSENERVRAAVAALAVADLVALGALLVDGHRSLRDDYAVSVPAVDELVQLLVATPGVFGARMTGGGFGGCVVAVCRPHALDHVVLGNGRRRAFHVRAVGRAEVRSTEPLR